MCSTWRLTTAQAIVRYLQQQYSEFDGERERLIGGMFAIFGHGNVASVSPALSEFGQALDFYQPKNEQAMVHAAIGYAKAKNRRATLACSASIGPGSTNMITGAAAATINRIPVLLFPADTFAHRRSGNVLQQLEHPVSADVSVNDCFRPISRFFDRISRAEQLMTALPEAMRVLVDPAETGAVTIALPQDVAGEAYDYPISFFQERIWPIRRRVPADQDISAAVALLANAQKPLIISGGGVRYSAAQDELRAFSNEFGIPVAETHAGKGTALDATYCVGGAGVSGTAAAGRVAEIADVVIAIGTRLQDFVTGSRSAFQNAAVRFVAVNVNAYDAYKFRGVSILGDARMTIQALASALRARGYSTEPEFRSLVRNEILRWRESYAADIAVAPGAALTQGTIVKIVNDIAQSGDTVVAAAGTPPGEILKGWDNSRGSECFIEFGFSTMGHEIPAGLGVRLARESGEVYVIIGDGTYLMSPTEITTAMQERAKITVVVIENSGYQCIRDLQQATTAIENFGNEFRARAKGSRLSGSYFEVNYAENARSMGATVFAARTADDFVNALVRAKAVKDAPVVIIVSADKRHRSVGSGVWWDVGVVHTSSKPATIEAAEAFRAGAVHQRVLG